VDEAQRAKFVLPQQSLKTIYSHPLKFIFSTPLVLYGSHAGSLLIPQYSEYQQATRFCILEYLLAGNLKLYKSPQALKNGLPLPFHFSRWKD
jgi:hypothetical protein